MGQRLTDDKINLNCDMRSHTSKKANYNHNHKKRPPPKINRRQNDIYITNKSNFKAQQKHCEELLNSGIKEIYLHCLGSAIIRGLNLALSLVKNSNDALTYAINTSTVNLIENIMGQRLTDDKINLNCDMRSHTSKKANYNHNHKKRPPPKINRRQNDIYITNKSNFKAQQKHCEELLNSGIKEIYLHCLGSAIIRGLNLALSLVKNSNDALTYAINTSTVNLIDEYHPLCDDDDVSMLLRNNSAVHIKIIRNSVHDVDVAFFK